MSGDDELSIAFVGALPLDEDCTPENPAYSPAGRMLQQRILGALAGAGVRIDRSFLLRAVAAFPRTRHLLVRGRRATVAGAPARYLPFVNLPVVKNATAAVAFFVALLRWGFTRRGPRAIVTYNVANPSGLPVLLAARLTRTPVFAIVADIPVPGSGMVPGGALRRLDFAAQTRSLRRFDGLIVLTERMATDFAPGVPFLFMEGAVPDNVAGGGPVGAGSATERGPDEFVLMYSGGLTAFKGTPLLLEAFAGVRDRRARLWLAGGGDAQPAVEAAAARDPRIRFLGMLPNERVLELYRQASALVNPHSSTALSARYVFPSKLLEYLAAGRPVISTVSTPEVQAVYGRYIHPVPGDDPAALTAVIERLMREDPAVLDAKAADGRRYVLEHKSWSSQGARMARFLRERVAVVAR